MAENPSIQGNPASIQGPTQGPIGGASAAKRSQETQTPESGAAFRALLDKLQDQVKGLNEAGAKLQSPEELAGAVDQARESLEGALTLKDRLLEAYRAAEQRAGNSD